MDRQLRRQEQWQLTSGPRNERPSLISQLGRFLGGVLVIVWTAGAACGRPYTNLFVFGDSLSDVGNAPAGTGYWNGRYSNGPVWAEYLATNLQLPALSRSLAGGTDYAYSGAEAGSGTSWQGTPNVGMQVSSYLAAVGDHAELAALYSVWAGGNDFIHAVATSSPLTPAVWADNLVGAIGTLYDHGAVNFLVPNLPPLASTPVGNTLSADGRAMLDSSVQTFNDQLSADLQALQNIHSELKVQRLDVYSLMSNVIAHPSAYGFTNVADPANAAPAGTDVSTYLFWDILHPTTTAHYLLAEEVPEPSGLMLLVIAAVGWAVARGYYFRHTYTV
jgi:phospholipase/lecithinase/hemolysin